MKSRREPRNCRCAMILRITYEDFFATLETNAASACLITIITPFTPQCYLLPLDIRPVGFTPAYGSLNKGVVRQCPSRQHQWTYTAAEAERGAGQSVVTNPSWASV